MAGEAVTRSGQPVSGDSNGRCVAGPDSDNDDYRYGPPDKHSPGSGGRPAMLGRGCSEAGELTNTDPPNLLLEVKREQILTKYRWLSYSFFFFLLDCSHVHELHTLGWTLKSRK